jgi:hypothetical protein
MTPTGVMSSFSSVKIRQSTGKACSNVSRTRNLNLWVLTVIAIATPMNNMNTAKLICTVSGSSLNSLYSPTAIAHPIANGIAILAKPTLSAIFQFDNRNRRSTSSPMMNKNKVRPRFATKLRLVIDSAGKMDCLKPGIRPMTDGPRMMPPMISDITRGWRILERGQLSARQKIMMMPACCAHCQYVVFV